MEDKMPRGDRTGPAGQGPMTGRARGYCSGSGAPGFANGGFGRRFGTGRGFGWGARALPIQQPAIITDKQEKQILEQDLADLKEEMKEIEERLKELKK
jgi:hypothetical protein